MAAEKGHQWFAAVYDRLMTSAERSYMKGVGPLTALALAAVFLVGGTAQTDAAFPGTNGKIAFSSNRDGNAEIYVMDADGGGQTRLTDNPAPDGEPAWSPDGTKIALWGGKTHPYL